MTATVPSAVLEVALAKYGYSPGLFVGHTTEMVRQRARSLRTEAASAWATAEHHAAAHVEADALDALADRYEQEPTR